MENSFKIVQKYFKDTPTCSNMLQPALICSYILKPATCSSNILITNRPRFILLYCWQHLQQQIGKKKVLKTSANLGVVYDQ